MDTSLLRTALVAFFDNSFIQATNEFYIHQPGGVELSVRTHNDSEMVVFLSYQRQTIPAEIWEGMRIVNPNTHQEVDCDCKVIGAEAIFGFSSTVIHFQRCAPGDLYRVELYRPYEPQQPSRSDNFGGA